MGIRGWFDKKNQEKELEAAKRENELERLRTNTAAARAQRSYVQQFMNSAEPVTQKRGQKAITTRACHRNLTSKKTGRH